MTEPRNDGYLVSTLLYKFLTRAYCLIDTVISKSHDVVLFFLNLDPSNKGLYVNNKQYSLSSQKAFKLAMTYSTRLFSGQSIDVQSLTHLLVISNKNVSITVFTKTMQRATLLSKV